jgi:molecular chaperone Hsp33
MGDRLLRGLVEGRGLRVIYARVTETARVARMLHGCYPTAAVLFAEALAGGALLGALQKERSRVNLQVECDGPLGGLFVDADTEGSVRGYVRRPQVHFLGDVRAGARAALGRAGFLSVLRDLGGGNFYRGSVELGELDLPGYLRRYFSESEQVATALDIQVIDAPGEPIAEAAGLLVQRLPEGAEEAVPEIGRRLETGALREALLRQRPPQEVIREVLGQGFDLLAEFEVAYHCSCSAGRARAAVSALGLEGIADVLDAEKQAVITCEFCRARYLVSEPELRDIARRLAERDAPGD